jgi:flagellar protein FlbD
LFDIFSEKSNPEECMILVTRLDRQVMLLNPDLIVTVEETPDTVITLINGHHLLVRERAQVLLNRIVAYRTTILRRSGSAAVGRKYLARRRLGQYGRPKTDQPELQPPFHRQDS